MRPQLLSLSDRLKSENAEMRHEVWSFELSQMPCWLALKRAQLHPALGSCRRWLPTLGKAAIWPSGYRWLLGNPWILVKDAPQTRSISIAPLKRTREPRVFYSAGLGSGSARSAGCRQQTPKCAEVSVGARAIAQGQTSSPPLSFTLLKSAGETVLP